MIKILVASVGGLFVAAYFIFDLSEIETGLITLYGTMIIYGLLTVCLSTITTYFLYRSTFKTPGSSLVLLIIMIGLTAFMFGVQLCSIYFNYWDSTLFIEFAEGTLWIPAFLLFCNVLLLAVALLDKNKKGSDLS